MDDSDDYSAYFIDKQVGMGRRGYGGISHVYIGTPNQRGHGIGSFLGGLFRSILPFLKSGAKAVGKEVLRTGVKIASDVVDREIPVRDSFHTRVRESGRNLKRQAEEKIDTLMRGSGYIPDSLNDAEHSVYNRSPMHIGTAKKIRVSKSKKRPKKRVASQKNKKKKRVVNKKKKKKLRTVSDIFH